MLNKLSVISAASLFLIAPVANAIEYNELEVYPYNTASHGEWEFENMTTASNGDGTPGAGVIRSSFEVNYGLSDRYEFAIYNDFSRPDGTNVSYAGTRAHARTRFFEKNELPLDFGAYVEAGFPQADANIFEMEFRGIIEKDIGYFTFDFNPIIEQGIVGQETTPQLEYAFAAIYRVSERWRPHVDVFGDVSPATLLLSPAVDFKLGKGLLAGLGVGFGMNSATEQNLVRTRLEYEF